MIIDGALGSEAIDSSGEVLDVKGADISDAEKGTMLLNWEHTLGEKGPDTIVGVVLRAKKIFNRDDCDTDRERMYWDEIKLPFIYGVSRLYDGAGHEKAKAIAAIIRDHVANGEKVICRYSVEGSTLHKEDNRLADSIVRRVAITVKPCNRTAISGLIEDPMAPPGFDKKPAKEKVKDLLADLEETKKSEDPTRQLLCRTELTCNPIMEDPLAKAYSAGVGSAAPGALTGGAALQREDLGPHSVKKQAEEAAHVLSEYGDRKFDKAEFRAFAKNKLPEASDEFLDHFADMAADYHVKRSLIKKEGAAAPAPKPAKAAPQPKAPKVAAAPKPAAPAKPKMKAAPAPAAKPPSFLDEEDPNPVKIEQATIRGVPVTPQKIKGGIQFDEVNGILHTSKGSFPLYNPDTGFKTVSGKGVKKAFYDKGVLNVPAGTDLKQFPHNGPNPHFREIYNSEPIEEFHSGKVMPNWTRVHDLLKAKRLPEEVVMHSAIFSMLSPNTPVRPHELMHAHMVDTWEDTGIDPRDPDFKKARKHWLDKDKPQNYPRTAEDYFRAHSDVHLDADSVGNGRKAGDLKAFMLANNKFKNISKYHELHRTLMDLVGKHGTDARAAAKELMAHKAKETLWKTQRRAFRTKLKEKLANEMGLRDDVTAYVKQKMAAMKAQKGQEREPGADDDDETPMAWNPALIGTGADGEQFNPKLAYSFARSPNAVAKDKFTQEALDQGLKDSLSETAEAQTRAHPEYGAYKGVEVPGLAPKTGRFAFTMMGGGNSFVPDTHIVRHLFGMDGNKDGKTLAYLKSALWNSKNHHILEGIDRWYAKNHPAAQLMQKHPKWSEHFKDDPEQANFPAFWRHWCSISQDERDRGMGTGDARNEFSTHEPFWMGIDKYVKSEAPDQNMIAKMIALHHQYANDYGEVPAQMMYYAHCIPHLIEASQYRERHDDFEDFAKSVERDQLEIELRKTAADMEIAKFSDPTVPSVHSVDYKVDGGWHRAGRFMLHDGRLTHLEDYYGLLKKLLPAGKVTGKTISSIHGLKMSPHLKIDIDEPDLAAGEKKKDQETEPGSPDVGDTQAQAAPTAPTARPASVFEYQRAGHDKPHTIEVHGGVYTQDGNRLTFPEIQAILDNWKKGAATIRYKQAPQIQAMAKMEEVITDLLKDENENLPDIDESLQQVRSLVERGLLDPKYERAMTQHVMADSRVPSLGNAYAYEKFKQKQKPGVHIQMDGNDFKAINDRFGHEAGNNAIKAFGNAARAAMDETVGKQNGKLFRNGGDEFAAHVPSNEHAAQFSRALSQKLQDLPPIGGIHKLSMSFGFGHNPETADAALYEAKKQKLHPTTGQRLYPVGQAPNFAHSLVPGSEGAIPVHDSAHALVHSAMKAAPTGSIKAPSPKEDEKFGRALPVAGTLDLAQHPPAPVQPAAPAPAPAAPTPHA